MVQVPCQTLRLVTKSEHWASSRCLTREKNKMLIRPVVLAEPAREEGEQILYLGRNVPGGMFYPSFCSPRLRTRLTTGECAG